MTTIEFPQHTLSRLLANGTALHLSPMEPQPTRMDEDISFIEWGESWATYDKRMSYEDTEVIDEWMLDWKHGDVVAYVGIPGTMGAEYARCLSVSPLRLAELSEEQFGENGIELPKGTVILAYFGARRNALMGLLVKWWEKTYPAHPWESSWAWASTWTLEKGA